ncbi:hypothetical protein HDK77DRAFT_19429 [Phyllosticta capitalensis]
MSQPPNQPPRPLSNFLCLVSFAVFAVSLERSPRSSLHRIAGARCVCTYPSFPPPRLLPCRWGRRSADRRVLSVYPVRLHSLSAIPSVHGVKWASQPGLHQAFSMFPTLAKQVGFDCFEMISPPRTRTTLSVFCGFLWFCFFDTPFRILKKGCYGVELMRREAKN